MLKLIDNSSAFYGAGLSLQRKIFKVKSGSYAGRIAAIYPTESSSIALSYADPPYLSWSSPWVFVSDSADYPAGCWMDGSGNINVAYTAESSLDLIHKTLNFNNGNWTTGSVTTICNLNSNYYPSVYKDIYNRIWVCWTHVDSGNFGVNVKVYAEGSAQWGLGPDDPGTVLASGSSSAFSRLEYLPTYIYCFYSINGSSLAYRRYEISGALWESECELYDGSGPADNFCSAVSNDLRIGLVFMSDTDLYFKDYDGAVWSGNHLIDGDVAVAPVLKYNGSIPFVFYGKEIGSEQNQLYYSQRNGTSFSTPVRVTGELASFDRVFCYRPSATAMYYDRSSEAADESGSDVYHPDSGKMLKDSGDALFIGQSDKFNRIKINLGITGSGGTVSWHYWNGSVWKDFTPSSGEYNFDSSPVSIKLWEDTSDIPADWQSSIVAGSSKFWIRITVSTEFGTSPVGTQLTCADNLPFISTM